MTQETAAPFFNTLFLIGLFSATPFWILSLCGTIIAIFCHTKAYVTDSRCRYPDAISKNIIIPYREQELPTNCIALFFLGVFMVLFPPLVLSVPIYAFLRILRFIFRTKKRFDTVLKSGKCLKDYEEDGVKTEF